MRRFLAWEQFRLARLQWHGAVLSQGIANLHLLFLSTYLSPAGPLVANSYTWLLILKYAYYLAIHIYCKWSSLLEIRVGCLDDYLRFVFSWRQSCVWLFIFWSFCIQAPSSILLVLLLSLCNRVLFASLQQTFDDRLSCYVGYPRVNQAYELHPGAGFLIIIIPIDRSFPSTMIFIPVAIISYSVPGYSDLKHIKKKWCEIYGEGNFCFALGSKNVESICPSLLEHTVYRAPNPAQIFRFFFQLV